MAKRPYRRRDVEKTPAPAESGRLVDPWEQWNVWAREAIERLWAPI